MRGTHSCPSLIATCPQLATVLLLPALRILKNTPGLGNSYSPKNSGNVTIVEGGKYLIYCVAPPPKDPLDRRHCLAVREAKDRGVKQYVTLNKHLTFLCPDTSLCKMKEWTT